MKRLITIAAIALSLVLAGASAASAWTTPRKSGTEVITGSTTNLQIILSNNSVLPVKAFGVVRTEGTISLGGSPNGRSTFYFRDGTLRVKHTQTSGGTQPSFNSYTCTAFLSQDGVYTVVKGTGAFHNAKGHGWFTVTFFLRFPVKNGKCTASQSTQPISGKITFLAYGPLSVG